MKKYTILILFATFSLALSSCEKTLDISDLRNYTSDNVWNDEKLVNAYLANLYSSTFGGWPINSGGNADETMGILGIDAVQPNNDLFKSWPYQVIFKINTMIEELPKGKLRKELQDPLMGQALFLRAYHYFTPLMYHGGIPYITKVQQRSDPKDELLVARNTSAECFDLLIKDLDDAIALLPAKYTGVNYGKIDGSFALAFKAKVLLYKASAQFNPTNPTSNPYVEEAYQVNKLAYETLKSRGYSLFGDYSTLFTTDGNSEAVFAVVYQAPLKVNARQNHICRPITMSKDQTGADQPIWNLIQEYPMLDGKKPGESSKYPYEMQRFWENRDPRLNATHVFNGSLFELSGIVGRRQYTAKGVSHPSDGFYPEAGFPRSGIYPRKGMDISLAVAEVQMSGMDYTIMRFAEVMFNYAEIACSKGAVEVGYDILKQIRERAGIEPGDDGLYGLKAGMSPSEMREALIEEKRFEFCFEGQRFWDLRRNRMFSKINGMRKYGILAEYNGTITAEVIEKANKFQLTQSDFKYTQQEPFTDGQKIMIVPDSYYFFPIKQSSLESNPNLKQNIGWGGDFVPTL